MTAQEMNVVEQLNEPEFPTQMQIDHAEIRRLRGVVIRARDLLRRAVTEGYSRHEFNSFLSADENRARPSGADEEMPPPAPSGAQEAKL